jgi:alpha-tubulin suppressor-like RCC1 family protein
LHFTALSAGENFNCALDVNGSAWCWGQGLSGVLGDGSQADSTASVQVTAAERFVTLRAGGSVCASTAAGQAF